MSNIVARIKQVLEAALKIVQWLLSIIVFIPNSMIKSIAKRSE